MDNSDSAIVTRFRISCMIIMLMYVLLLGSSALYAFYTGQQSPHLLYITCGLFLLSIPLILKDWIRYWKIARKSGGSNVIDDELFQLNNAKAMNIGFISLMISQVALLISGFFINSIDVTIASIFSLVFGGSVCLASLIVLEIRA